MDLGIAGQVAVVTGAGSGIGAETARQLAAEGCKVVVWDMLAERAQRVAQQLRDGGADAMAVTGSVAKSSEVNAVIQQVIAKYGTIHILVNNAGFGDDGPLTEMTDDMWYRVIDVCLSGPFFCARAVAPYMIAQKYGRIINVGSRAHLGLPTKANYCAAKAGVTGLTKSMGMELGVHNITVNTVHPGIVRTERVLAQKMYPEMNVAAQRTQMIKQEGTPADIANAIMFYASARTSFVSGDEVFATGGRYG